VFVKRLPPPPHFFARTPVFSRDSEQISPGGRPEASNKRFCSCMRLASHLSYDPPTNLVLHRPPRRGRSTIACSSSTKILALFLIFFFSSLEDNTATRMSTRSPPPLLVSTLPGFTWLFFFRRAPLYLWHSRVAGSGPSRITECPPVFFYPRKGLLFFGLVTTALMTLPYVVSYLPRISDLPTGVGE